MIFLIKVWISLDEVLATETATAWNMEIPGFLNHSQLQIFKNYRFLLLFSCYFNVCTFEVWLYWYFFRKGWGSLLGFFPFRQLRPETGESPAKISKALTTIKYFYFIIIFCFTFSSFKGPESSYWVILLFLVRGDVLWRKWRPLK